MAEDHFGTDVAAIYDESCAAIFTPDALGPTIDRLAELAAGGPALEPGGSFLIEVGVPDLRRLPPGEDARVFAHSIGYIGYDRYTDLVKQHAVSHHVHARDGSMVETTTPFRFVWPSELDLMGRLAGLNLRHRWSDWNRAPFTAESRSHISVWEKPRT